MFTLVATLNHNIGDFFFFFVGNIGALQNGLF